MKTELWNGHEIRFVEKDNEWWAVAKDVAEALGYQLTTNMTRILDKKDKGMHKVNTTSVCGAYKVGITSKKARKMQEMLIITEFGVYDAVFNSHKPEAKEFKRWVFKVLKELRQSTGLEGFQIFRMLDKEHQKEAMARLNQSLHNPVQVSFIKANTIANKAVSIKYGYPKMVKKGDMSPEMLKDREVLLDETVELMRMKEKYRLDISVSERVYRSIDNKKAG